MERLNETKHRLLLMDTEATQPDDFLFYSTDVLDFTCNLVGCSAKKCLFVGIKIEFNWLKLRVFSGINLKNSFLYENEKKAELFLEREIGYISGIVKFVHIKCEGTSGTCLPRGHSIWPSKHRLFCEEPMVFNIYLQIQSN